MPYPLFNWLDSRGTGMLLHPSSLPGDLGIGTFGEEARRFIDFLEASGIEYWQVCPLGPTGYGDSPYQCFSAFAGNPYFINLHELVEWKLLKDDELNVLRELPHDHVDYGALFNYHGKVLYKAYLNFKKQGKGFAKAKAWETFLKKEPEWLDAYALFQALKNDQLGQEWVKWPVECRSYAKAKESKQHKALTQEIEAQKFYQFIFFDQWARLREYAAGKGIKVIGDIPIFVSADSAEVWARPELFQMNKEGKPSGFAGVPPDYFSETGQFWGNPLYDWAYHKKEKYAWWIERMRANFELYDVVRLDHFRGFDTYWAIPRGAEDARTGEWKKGPGIEFFEAIKKGLPDAKLIAEDLGDITPDVIQLRDESGLPGMAILQFAFNKDPHNAFLPHNYGRNLVVYAGTHDNGTTQGWYAILPEEYKDQVRRYFRVSGDDIAWDFIRQLYQCNANLAVLCMQNLLNKGNEARMNYPGNAIGNWQWRFTAEELDYLMLRSADYLKELKWLYGR